MSHAFLYVSSCIFIHFACIFMHHGVPLTPDGVILPRGASPRKKVASIFSRGGHFFLRRGSAEMNIYALCGRDNEWADGQLRSLCGASGASTKQSRARINRARVTGHLGSQHPTPAPPLTGAGSGYRLDRRRGICSPHVLRHREPVGTPRPCRQWRGGSNWGATRRWGEAGQGWGQ